MKRVGNLYDKIYDIENIKLAHKNARKGKTHYSEVKQVDSNVDYYCKQISDMLKDKTFTNSQYNVFTKNDKGKERVIYKLPYYPDRVVHHAILQVLEPIWKKTFIRSTYQSIKGRGVHRAKVDVEQAIKQLGNNARYAQMDIKKFYPSVDNEIMKQIVAKKIKCKDTLWLLCTIIDSMDGLPIGNYISQYLGNLYLTYFDHEMKEKYQCRHYFRYCDDIVIISNYKDKVSKMVEVANTKLGGLKVKLKTQIKQDKVSNGLDFLGFVFYGNKTLLRKSIASNFKRTADEFVRNASKDLLNSVISYNGWIIVSDSYNLWKSKINTKLRQAAIQVNLNHKLIWR